MTICRRINKHWKGIKRKCKQNYWQKAYTSVNTVTLNFKVKVLSKQPVKLVCKNKSAKTAEY